MRQIIRLNVADQGYSLYSIDRRGMRREPLDTASETVPQEYLAAQHRLDELFAISDGPWSMTFRSSDEGCVLAYGCKIGGADQMGRRGLILIHGILLGSPRELPACLLGVLTLLSPTRVGYLTRSMEEVAQGSLPVQKILEWLVRETERRARDHQSLQMASKADKWKISEVSHDCAGAAAFVWLLFARQQANARGPWEVYDAPRNDGELMTRLAPSGGGQSTTASRLLAHLLASGETEAARTSREILPSLPARSETAASSERRATLLHQEAASDSKERSQESVGPERSAGHGSMKWFAVGFVLLMTVSLTSWLSKTRDFKPIVQEAVRRITDEADQGVSSITEARSKALKQIEEKSKSLLEHIDESTRVAISLDPPEPQGCDEDREIGRMAIQKAGDRALLYICTPEEDGWLQVGQRPKVERAARPQPAR